MPGRFYHCVTQVLDSEKSTKRRVRVLRTKDLLDIFLGNGKAEERSLSASQRLVAFYRIPAVRRFASCPHQLHPRMVR